MVKKASSLIALCSLISLQGCSDKFPQYSGKFELTASSYTNPAFAGEKRLPWDLTITHRMRYIPATWDDKLRFEFTPGCSSTEISGAVVFDLEKLTSPDESTFPYEYFRGQQIHQEKEYYGGAFCNYQYQYHAFATLTPGVAALTKVWPERGEYLYTDPNGMPVHETFNPDQFEPSEEAICEWYKALEDNGNTITIHLFISRNIKSDFTGCDSNSYLPYDTRGTESLKAVYHSTELHDEEDPRIGFDELLVNTIPPIDLFKEVISGVKDL